MKTVTLGPALESIGRECFSSNLETVYFIGSRSQNKCEASLENATVIYSAYDVVFDTGSECNDVIDPQIVEKDARAVKPSSDPKLAGSVFTGWYTDEECKNAYDFGQPVKEDITLYAGWK